MQHLSKQLSFFVLLLSIMVIFSSNTYAQQATDSQVALEQALNKHKGEVIYLDFWASWCGPCRKSFPWMNKIDAEYKQQGFSVISINLDANKDLAAKFLSETPASFTVIYDPKGKIAKHFKIQGMPSSMLIGRDGKIKSRHTGFFTNKISLYQQEIEQLLATK
ncbi:TlpA family protein disulfide reductase [Candidatus Colwellia aromaticivorans]|uniref:TlpA family protein disulfide reductase n=1 Tax=Candidatus Colwellia aromaticivorans TaxID=2267621 RepID=UPI001FE697CC|nr:TlpA disulfide reductase family protein [Candidatus Colwellia aromaticivorans]